MFFYPIDGNIAIPTCAARDIGSRAVRLLRDRSWTGQAGTGVHGPADLSFNEMAGVMSKVLGRPIRFQEVPEPAYKATLVEHGQSEAFAQGLVDMFREIAEGIHAADPRTPESTTPTTLRSGALIRSSPRSDNPHKKAGHSALLIRSDCWLLWSGGTNSTSLSGRRRYVPLSLSA